MPNHNHHDDGDQFKKDNLDWREKRDKDVLKALRTEGFCLACLPPVGAPASDRSDFTAALVSLDGCPNLVVAAPRLTPELLKKTIEELPQRQFADGKTIQVADQFSPAPAN